jgi:hypothetical protein
MHSGFSESDKSLKKCVEDLLRNRDFDHLLELCEKDRRFWQEVRFRLYEIDESLRWPAIETAGRLMRRWWKSGDEERVREYVRTLFWSMSDESGGIGWSAPQTIAETIAHIPELMDPYGNMMIAYSVGEPSLAKGCLWGIGRLGLKIAGCLNSFRDMILAVLGGDDAEVLGLASWALGEAGFMDALPRLKELRSRTEQVRIYMDGHFCEKTLGRWSEEAIKKMEKVL